MRAVVILLLAVAATAGDDEIKAKFKTELTRIYNYLPADVDQQVREAKSKEMDGFWELVMGRPDVCLPLLREELRRKDQNAFFLYDGSALLLKVSKEKADFELAADAVGRCRIQDVSDKAYFYFVHKICMQDVDAFAAVAKMLESPEFRFYLVEHALEMRQYDCVFFCALCLGEERWVPGMIQRLATEKDPTALETILTGLSMAVTPEADATLREFAKREGLEARTRDHLDELLQGLKPVDLPAREPKTKRADFDAFLKGCEAGRMPVLKPGDSLIPDAPYLVTREDMPRIRAARRKIAERVSDEAMEEIALLTALLRIAATRAG